MLQTIRPTLERMLAQAIDPEIRQQAASLIGIADALLEAQTHIEKQRADPVARLNRVQRHTKSGVWEYDPVTHTLWMSPNAYRLFGFGPEHAPTPEEVAACFVESGAAQWLSHLKGESTGNNAAMILDAIRGTDTWKCRVQTNIVTDAFGKIVRIDGVFIDVTELITTQNRLDLLFNTMVIGVAQHELICDEQGRPIDYRFEAVNPAFERLTGLCGDEIIGRTVLQILPGTEPFWIETYGQVTLTGEPVTFENYSSQLDRWFEVTAFRHRPMGFTCLVSDITRRRRTEQALEINEERLRLTLEATQDGIWDWDVKSGKAVFSPTYYTMLGYSVDAFPSSYESWRNLLHPEDLQRTEAYIQRHLTDPDGFVVEFRARTAEGGWKWILGRGRSVAFDADGNPVRMVGTHTDITRRKEAEQALADSELRYRALSDLTVEGIVIHDGGIVIDLNASAERILASTRSKLQGTDLLSLVHHEDLPTVLHNMSRAYAQPYQIRMYRLTGEMFWAEVESRNIEMQGRPCRVSAIRDVTDRRIAEEALMHERQRLQFVIDAASLGAWEWNLQTNITVFNETWANMLGYTLEELTPYDYNTWERLVHPDDLENARDAISRYISGESTQYESVHRLRHKQGHWVWVLDRGRIMTRDEHGRPLIMYGTHTDITEQKRIEEALSAQLQELQRWQALLLDRSDRSQALKLEVNTLLAQLGKPPKYPSVATSSELPDRQVEP